jgi:hypothetical protein
MNEQIVISRDYLDSIEKAIESQKDAIDCQAKYILQLEQAMDRVLDEWRYLKAAGV